LTSSQQPTSNEEVADQDADADVIAGGPEPRGRLPRPGGLVWLFVLAETVVLAVAVAVAVHYRAEARGLHPAVPAAASPAASPALPEVTTVVVALPADGTVKGTVVITTAALPGARRGQFTVYAVITGGMPGTFYDLIGNDCSTGDPVPDDVWATGLAGANGTAELIGYTWTGAVADRYWLVLDPSPVNPPPGLRGLFVQGQAKPYPAGRAPCAPSSGGKHGPHKA
jgi:hypothetical protein